MFFITQAQYEQLFVNTNLYHNGRKISTLPAVLPYGCHYQPYDDYSFFDGVTFHKPCLMRFDSPSADYVIVREQHWTNDRATGKPRLIQKYRTAGFKVFRFKILVDLAMTLHFFRLCRAMKPRLDADGLHYDHNDK